MHTNLSDKLGLLPGETIVVINSPQTYLSVLPPFINLKTTFQHSSFIHVFVTSKAQLQEYLPQITKFLDKKGMVWISWPKKASKVATDLSDIVIRDTILPTGLVDVKVAAIDEIWSGLKFVWRKR
jgi:hypothetical protein